MSTSSSNLELSPTDSQVLDSASLPSEPPDVRNWFSTYIYESPELNTLDGFGNHDGLAEPLNESNKEAKLGECRNVGKIEDSLASSGVKGFLDVIVECNESEHSKPDLGVSRLLESLSQCSEPPDIKNWFSSYKYASPPLDSAECNESELNKPAVLVSRFSEFLSQCSEPPDIKNWYSSYVYESPPLDTADGFMITDYKDKEDDNVYNAMKSCRVNDKEDVGENSNLVKNTKHDIQAICKDEHNLDFKLRSSVSNKWSSKSITEQILPGAPEQDTQNRNHCLAVKLKNTNTDYEDYNKERLRSESDTASLNGNTLYKSIETKDCVKSSSGKEDLHEHVTRGISLKRLTSEGIGKENELLQEGFVSTRKISRLTNTENERMPLGGQPESLKSRVKDELSIKKNVKTNRKVLSNATNLHLPIIPCITGKWRCPQKGKPDLGPPLKQLRLEQWIRRV